jgi:transposase
MLQPVVRRTWAPKGQTPILRAWDRHDRLSVISGLTLAPRRQRLGLYWDVQTENVRGPHVVHFLRALRSRLRRKLVLILDLWNVHRSKVMREYLGRHAGNVRVEWLPAYAPELNPTEQVWNHTKYSDLANFIPKDRADLYAHVDESISAQSTQSSLLRSFFTTAKLKLWK